MSTEPHPTPTPAPDPAPQLGAPAPGAEPATRQVPQQQPATQQVPVQQAPVQQPPVQAGAPKPGPQINRTRTSGMWFAIGSFALILLFLLIFILQNNKSVEVSYLGAHGHLPLGVALLLAAVCGVLLAILAGAARILQLRTVARRHRRSDARRAAAANVPADPGPAGTPNA